MTTKPTSGTSVATATSAPEAPNPIIAMLPTTIRLLAIIAGDPSLGARGVALGAALNLTAQAIERGRAAEQAFRELTAQVQALAAKDNREDLQVWADIKALVDSAEQVFQTGR